MLRNGLKSNESLISLDLSYNPLTADEVEFLATVFFEQREEPIPLNRIDFGETWVKKSFIKVNFTFFIIRENSICSMIIRYITE